MAAPNPLGGAGSARKGGLPPKPGSLSHALLSQSKNMIRLLGTLTTRNRSKSKRWNRASQAVMFLRFGQEGLQRFKGTHSRLVYLMNEIKMLLLLVWLAHFENFTLKYSNSSFAIRVNLCHCWPSLFLYGLSLPLWCFSILVNYYFQVSFHLKILYVAKKRQITVTELL